MSDDANSLGARLRSAFANFNSRLNSVVEKIQRKTSCYAEKPPLVFTMPVIQYDPEKKVATTTSSSGAPAVRLSEMAPSDEANKEKRTEDPETKGAEPSATARDRRCKPCRDRGEEIRAPGPNTAAKDVVPQQAGCLAYMHSECPLNRRELGRASWAYLHTLAAYYPEKPTPEQQEEMKEFIKTFARWYPCGYCADMTYAEMIRKPPRVESQQAFALWMCEIHNEVNDRMGKPIFDCSKVQERWKTGPRDGSCNL